LADVEAFGFRRDLTFVMRGLDPRIHVLVRDRQNVDGRVIGETTPFFERLCPAMTLAGCFR
jgi:hypothetical protein